MRMGVVGNINNITCMKNLNSNVTQTLEESVLYLLYVHKQLPIPIQIAKQLKQQGYLVEGILGTEYSDGTQDGWLVTTLGYSYLVERGIKL